MSSNSSRAKNEAHGVEERPEARAKLVGECQILKHGGKLLFGRIAPIAEQLRREEHAGVVVKIGAREDDMSRR